MIQVTIFQKSILTDPSIELTKSIDHQTEVMPNQCETHNINYKKSSVKINNIQPTFTLYVPTVQEFKPKREQLTQEGENKSNLTPNSRNCTSPSPPVTSLSLSLSLSLSPFLFSFFLSLSFQVFTIYPQTLFDSPGSIRKSSNNTQTETKSIQNNTRKKQKRTNKTHSNGNNQKTEEKNRAK